MEANPESESSGSNFNSNEWAPSLSPVSSSYNTSMESRAESKTDTVRECLGISEFNQVKEVIMVHLGYEDRGSQVHLLQKHGNICIKLIFEAKI